MNHFNLKKTPAFCLLLVTLVVSGCSNKQLYSGMKNNAHQECAKLPKSSYEECMGSYSGDFETYSQEREELLK